MPFQTVIAKPAVDPVADRLETIDRVVAIGFGDIDIMLQQLQIIPDRPVAKLDVLDQVDITYKQDFLEVVGHDDLVLGSLYAEGQGIAAAVTQKLDIGPADVIDKFQKVVF